MWRASCCRSRRASALIASGWAIVWMVVLAASAELTHISLAAHERVGRVGAELLHHDYFPGTFSPPPPAASRHPTRSRNQRSDDVRRRLSSDSVVVRATVVGAARHGTAIAAIATVYDWQAIADIHARRAQGKSHVLAADAHGGREIATPAIRLDSVFRAPAAILARYDSVAGGLIDHQLWVSAGAMEYGASERCRWMPGWDGAICCRSTTSTERRRRGSPRSGLAGLAAPARTGRCERGARASRGRGGDGRRASRDSLVRRRASRRRGGSGLHSWRVSGTALASAPRSVRASDHLSAGQGTPVTLP